MEPGIYPNIPEDEYHASNGVSVSKLKIFAKAPAKARYGEKKEAKALSFGSLIHCAVLQSHLLETLYHPCDLERLNPRDGAYKEEAAKAMGRELVKRPEFENALRIRDAVHKHPVAAELLKPQLLVEQSFYWIDEETGLLCRGRADGIRPEMRILVDLKSTEDASEVEFGWSCRNYKYHWQDAFYRDGVEAACGWTPEAFIFLAVEKEAPFLVGAYELSPADLEEGRQEVRAQLTRYADCQRNNDWPGYSPTLETLTLPRRAVYA
ncbi:PD-(D/E)XK nuclease-like domain-containing protein [Azospirillum sp.]|uniref:PD-(D/E)XK nuclease-like domain-containing protein n=1 Tax=Azospirillum sp. TaxID=34012 RepID=UPI003D764499